MLGALGWPVAAGHGAGSGPPEQRTWVHVSHTDGQACPSLSTADLCVPYRDVDRVRSPQERALGTPPSLGAVL